MEMKLIRAEEINIYIKLNNQITYTRAHAFAYKLRTWEKRGHLQLRLIIVTLKLRKDTYG